MSPFALRGADPHHPPIPLDIIPSEHFVSVEPSQQTNSTRESLRKIRQDTRQTRSLEVLRQNFEALQSLRRQSIDDFDLQVMIGDIHQEIVDRARYLRGDTPTPTVAKDDHSVIFQAKPSGARQPETEFPPIPAVVPLPDLSTPAPADQPVAAPSPNTTPVTLPTPEPALPKPDVPTDAAVIPPEVTRIDAASWKKIVWLATFLCAIALAAFFYLIQTARKLNNMPDEGHPQQVEQAAKPANPVTAPVSISPSLRLYTDLTGGTATLDNNAPRSLVDGELMLDNLPAGQHSFKVAGSSGSASFQFEVSAKNAPKVVGTPQATNALAVLVSEQDGHGQLVTSTAGTSQILLDGNAAGQTSDAGLELVGLGSVDHDLQVVHDRDRQRFVMTYTPAPVLTVYVKSDSNTGILQVVTGEDNVQVYIGDDLFRRRTDHGQVRISIRAGHYSIRVHKDGLSDPPAQAVDVKKADVTQVRFDFGTPGAVAGLQIHGAQPGTTAYIDKEFVAAIGPDGNVKVSNIKPGEHTIELRHDLAATKRLQRTFHPGETLTLAPPDVTLEKNAADAGKPGSPVVVPVGSGNDPAKSANPAGGEAQPEGTRVQKGGGFVPYDTPKSPGHYSFRTQGHVGGILKKGKLQWYAGYQDPQNYILFSLDGKHAEVREMRNGKNILWSRVNCNVDSSSWVQVDLAVKPGAISSRVKTGGDSWVELGSVSSFGRDFTQDKVGFYIPPNDEVAVTNFKFANR